jgi:uncharacterized protein YaaR (DUF327 family)
MKVERNKKELGSYTPLGKTGLPEVRKSGESTFDQELSQHKEAFSQLKIREILAEIDKVSANLSRNVNLNDLMLYKKLVKNFMKEASSEAYQISKKRGRNRSGRTILITVKTIDSEIDALINEFRSNQNEPMEILATLDKIRGMLLDLMI